MITSDASSHDNAFCFIAPHAGSLYVVAAYDMSLRRSSSLRPPAVAIYAMPSDARFEYVLHQRPVIGVRLLFRPDETMSKFYLAASAAARYGTLARVSSLIKHGSARRSGTPMRDV